MGRELGKKKRDKVQGRDSQECKMINLINYMFWVEQVGVDPPPGSKSHRLFTVKHESRRCKFVKMLKRCAASYGVNPEIRGPQNKGKRI